jgi:hypothetical protein
LYSSKRAETLLSRGKAVGKEDYEDWRYKITPRNVDAPDFQAAQANGELVANMDRGPILITPTGETIGRSKAIERFISSEKIQINGKFGSSSRSN